MIKIRPESFRLIIVAKWDRGSFVYDSFRSECTKQPLKESDLL